MNLPSLVVLGLLAADVPGPYPRMAPVEQYLMADRADEIALARSAAHPAIANDASVLVFTKTGFETAANGTNGFVCMVQRAWSSPPFIGGKPYPDFWNPKVRAPICFNPDAVDAVLPLQIKRTEWALAGLSFDQIHDKIAEAVRDGDLRAPLPTAIAYMMSPRQYLGDRVHHFVPHLMLYLAHATDKKLGSRTSGAPLLIGESPGSPLAVVIVPVPKWSDGTDAGKAGH